MQTRKQIQRQYNNQNKSKFWNWNALYSAVLGVMLIMMPMFVSDGQGWKFDKNSGVMIPQVFNIHGIDISKHNGIIQWENISKPIKDKNQIQFVIMKATEGSDLVDETFNENWYAAKQHGFKRGAYHFFNTESDPRLQALNYLINTKHEKGDIIPVLDFEHLSSSDYKNKKIVERAKIWLEVVEQDLGVKPIIYTNRPIFKKYLAEDFKSYSIWMSDYVNKSVSDLNAPNIIMWQHTDSGKISGINGKVDLDVFLGSQSRFEKIIL